MTKMRRFAAIAAAAAMTACMAMPMMTGFAATVTEGNGNTITVTPSDGATHKYEAYQIFAGTYSGGVLTDITWGDGVDGPALLAALKGDTTLGTYFATCEDAEDVANALAATSGDPATPVFEDDKANAQAFAKLVAANLTAVTSGSEATNGVTKLPDGYYLIQDSESPTNPDGSNPNSGAMTRYVVRVTAGATVEVNAKHSAPTVMKKVEEESLVGGTMETADFAGNSAFELGDGYNDIADYDIGDAVSFKLYGTLPSTFDDYAAYYYKFTDTLDSQFNAPAKENVKVYIDGTEAQNATVTVTGQNITVEFANIKNGNTVKANSIVTVEYDAVLNNTAEIGLPGQKNAVKLTYSNNPNWDGSGTSTTGETPEDGVIVFTYGIDINKVDETGTAKLANAKFAVKNSAGQYVTATGGKFSGFVTTAPDVASGDTTTGLFVSSADSVIAIEGLDAGTYTIVELEAPEGYNKLTEGIKVEVTPTMPTDRQAWTYAADGSTASAALTGLSVMYDAESAQTLGKDGAADVDTGKGTVKIENKKGTSLPGTGGIGTTIFYVVGGTLVAGAGVTLIAKKRMKKED